MANPILSIFEKGKSRRVVVREAVRPSVRMLLTYWQLCAIEGARKAKRKPPGPSGNTDNAEQRYFESAARFLSGCLSQLDQSFDSHAVAMAALAIAANDPMLPSDIADSVSLEMPEVKAHVAPKSLRKRSRSDTDRVTRTGA